MCLWAIAYVHSPNINRGQSAASLSTAQEAMHQAGLQGCARTAPSHSLAVEQLLVAAMITRFPPDRTHVNGKTYEGMYVKAMADLSARHPTDADVVAWYGQALMESTAWNYYSADGTLNAPSALAKAAFDSSLALNPAHPLTLHLGIHLLEPSTDHALLSNAEGYGDALQKYIEQHAGIGIGHLVHM